jgi:hypothetical protein
VTGRDSRGSGHNQTEGNITCFFNVTTKENQEIVNQANWHSYYWYDHIGNDEKFRNHPICT